MVNMLRAAKHAGYGIIVYTSRNWTEYDRLSGYLTRNGIPFDQLICGKPIGILYVDDRSCGRHGNADSLLSALYELTIRDAQGRSALMDGLAMETV